MRGFLTRMTVRGYAALWVAARWYSWAMLTPADLLVFAWLRSQMSLSYAGVSDKLVQKLGDQMDHTQAIPLSDSERDAMSLMVKVFPEYTASVGRRCTDHLNQGRKVEIEAVIHLARDGAALEEALTQ